MDDAFWESVRRDLSALVLRDKARHEHVALADVVSMRSCKTTWEKTFRWSLRDFGSSLVCDGWVTGDRDTMIDSVTRQEHPSITNDDWRDGVHWENVNGGHRIAASRYLEDQSDRPLAFPADVVHRTLSRTAASRLGEKVAIVVSDDINQLKSFAVRLAGAGIGCAHVESSEHGYLPVMAAAIAVDVRSRAVHLWLSRALGRDTSQLIIDASEF
ncbi:hypothetical protein EZI54_07365 [Marinobacter halodurans]|uniref:Uncharacterized protein n=1 Tax=Marinobacter halodurans TaxID=2528979 RepID=A0ABY1ZRH5_9GAMM|nr:hypothetical protein [Marinobacter halodurans]TBW57470.1 hypothetical protein EZI54_07365 [Marinobacter halodurans]